MKIPILTGIFALAAVTAAGANFSLGTYIYTGSVRNYKNELCSSADKLTVQAVATNGTILAEGKVVDPTAVGVNYRLEVPVSTKASGKSAAINDELNCVVVSAEGTTNVAARALPPVARVNAVARVNLVNASATSFDDGNGGTVLVADEYLQEIASMMRRRGKAEYEAFADWDGDGASNYAEYVAGTNPFDATDYLRITDFSMSGGKHLLSFEYAGGHLYALDSASSLSGATWKAAAFKADDAAASEQKSIWFEGNEYDDIGTATLYLTPAADSPTMFYAIRVE